MKILCIVQARMGSERLPGKVMRNILGKPMIIYTLDRIKKSKYIDEIVLATSLEKSEEPMVSYLIDHNYKIFRGDENNVLKRYVDATNEYGGDVIIRVTGDCPLIDSTIVDYVITFFLSHSFDYVRLDVPETFIRGLDIEIFTKEAINRVCNITKSIEGDSPYKEHVTYYMYTHPEEFSIGIVKGSNLFRKEHRLCVDTMEDFQLVTLIYEHFNDEYVSAKEVVKFLDENPMIAKMNQKIKQKQI